MIICTAVYFHFYRVLRVHHWQVAIMPHTHSHHILPLPQTSCGLALATIPSWLMIIIFVETIFQWLLCLIIIMGECE